MLVYYGNIQCISARELIDGGYITESCYRNWVNRGRIKVVRRGGGAAEIARWSPSIVCLPSAWNG